MQVTGKPLKLHFCMIPIMQHINYPFPFFLLKKKTAHKIFATHSSETFIQCLKSIRLQQDQIDTVSVEAQAMVKTSSAVRSIWTGRRLPAAARRYKLS
jgi:predicted DCC family thiol-disulfide oxidoreductase YuxK